MYAVYHTKEGLQAIASRVHGLAKSFAHLCQVHPSMDFELLQPEGRFFDTVALRTSPVNAEELSTHLTDIEKINIRVIDPSSISVSFDESHSGQDVVDLARAISRFKFQREPETPITVPTDEEIAQAWGGWAAATPCSASSSSASSSSAPAGEGEEAAPPAGPTGTGWGMHKEFARNPEDNFLYQKIFNSITSETEMLRYLTRLQNKDLSLAHSTITLGSCTMKLNSTASLLPISWDSIANVHPFAPKTSVKGYREMLHMLEAYLCKITAFDACSLQPASGASGEYAGLLAIRRYHESCGDGHRNLCIIPRSAHGTNPASAAMIGFEVRWIDDSEGMNVQELEALCEKEKDRLAALMIT